MADLVEAEIILILGPSVLAAAFATALRSEPLIEAAVGPIVAD